MEKLASVVIIGGLLIGSLVVVGVITLLTWLGIPLELILKVIGIGFIVFLLIGFYMSR